MNSSTSLDSLTKPLKRFIRRFHLLLFFLIVAAGFGGAILYLNSTIVEAGVDELYVSPINAGAIDQATLQRLKSLHSSDSTPAATFPEGRLNPFGEQ